MSRPPIVSFEPGSAPDEELAAYNRFSNRMRAEAWPEDPPVRLEETVQRLRTIPSFIGVRHWVAWDESGGEMIAEAGASIVHADHNQHVADFWINVAPEWRCQGVGRRLLASVAGGVREDGRRLLLSGTDGSVPAGRAFMERIGARLGQEAHTNQLLLADLDRELVRVWQERARERAVGFQLGWWDGPFPEESLAEVCQMKEAINLAPRGDLDVEDWHWTPEKLRETDQSMVARKAERWVACVRDPATGRIAGYTELFWSPERPENAGQGDTAVLPDYRNLGLGRWLKAAMLERLLRERPQVKRVRTGNADSNAPMLKINHELGFRPYKSWLVWQIELDSVLEYLRAAGEPVS